MALGVVSAGGADHRFATRARSQDQAATPRGDPLAVGVRTEPVSRSSPRIPLATKSLAAEHGDIAGGTSRSVAPPTEPQDIALLMLAQYGWDDSEFPCLDALWARESNWDPYAQNSYSGAYGIPQALPGSKMATVGSDWATNPATQIEWGLDYIQDRYGTPCGADSFQASNGWY